MDGTLEEEPEGELTFCDPFAPEKEHVPLPPDFTGQPVIRAAPEPFMPENPPSVLPAALLVVIVLTVIVAIIRDLTTASDHEQADHKADEENH